MAGVDFKHNRQVRPIVRRVSTIEGHGFTLERAIAAFRNEDAGMMTARTLTAGEFLADKTIHIIGIVAGVVGAVVLMAVAGRYGGTAGSLTAAAYAAGLVAMLSFSAAYNLSRGARAREVLCRFDHAAIFAMIAGTYTPFTILGLTGGWAVGMTFLVWSIAITGIVLKLVLPAGRFHGFSTGLYLAFGWIGLIAFKPLEATVGMPLLILIGIGGLVYSVGAVVHLLEKLPYHKAIWHGLVLAGVAIHYAAVMGLVAGRG